MILKYGSSGAGFKKPTGLVCPPACKGFHMIKNNPEKSKNLESGTMEIDAYRRDATINSIVYNLDRRLIKKFVDIVNYRCPRICHQPSVKVTSFSSPAQMVPLPCSPICHHHVFHFVCCRSRFRYSAWPRRHTFRNTTARSILVV